MRSGKNLSPGSTGSTITIIPAPAVKTAAGPAQVQTISRKTSGLLHFRENALKSAFFFRSNSVMSPFIVVFKTFFTEKSLKNLQVQQAPR
jgi:hypothetical protein